MAIIKEEIDLNVAEGTMAVVTFRDNDSAPRPAIVLVHDANGLLPAMLDIARGLAENGFVVAAPDVYHRVGRMQTGDPALPILDKMWLREGMTNEGHLLDMNALAAHFQGQDYVSDGLVDDLGKFCVASGTGIDVNADSVPVDDRLKRAFPDEWLTLALSGGEDYELAFAATAEIVEKAQKALGAQVTPIGRVREGEGVRVLDAGGAEIPVDRGGWDHFG